MKYVKKAAFWVSLVASLLIIGSTVSGWISNNKEPSKDNTASAQIVSVVE